MVTGMSRPCSKPSKWTRRRASPPPSLAKKSRCGDGVDHADIICHVTMEQERLMKEKEERKQAGRGGGAKFR